MLNQLQNFIVCYFFEAREGIIEMHLKSLGNFGKRRLTKILISACVDLVIQHLKFCIAQGTRKVAQSIER